MMIKPTDVDEYIASHSTKIQAILKRFRSTIKKSAPGAEELISYGMPAYKLNGMLVWFAAHAKHIGFYPKASGIARFKKEISEYKNAKGSVQFQLNEPIPFPLIKAIVKFRVEENKEKENLKIKAKKVKAKKIK
jgi:uncharacterized protein YdhG (YjbR/CyaY superfamily)